MSYICHSVYVWYFLVSLSGASFLSSVSGSRWTKVTRTKREEYAKIWTHCSMTHSQMQDKCFSTSQDYLVYCSKFTLLHKSAQEQLVFPFSFLLGCFKVFYIINISYFLFFSSQIWYWYTKMLGLRGDRSSDISRQTKYIHAGFMSPDARTQTLLYS